MLILPYFGSRSVGSLTKDDLAEWLAWAPKQKTSAAKRYSKATLQGAWRTLSVFMRFVCRKANLPNLFDRTVRFKIEVAGLPKMRPTPTPNKPELWRFLDALERVRLRRHPNPREWLKVRTILYLTAMSGARIGEVTALHKEDVDLVHDVIHIHRSNNKGNVRDTTKTEGSTRFVPLDPRAKALLLEYLKGWAPSAKWGAMLFLSQRGTPLASKRFRTIMDKACELAELPRITPHAFRRTVVNTVRQHTGDKAVSMAIAGHTTETMHLHYSTAEMAEKRAALSAAVWRGPAQSGGESGGAYSGSA